MNRTQALAVAKARNLRVVNSDLQAVAGKTCRVRVRSGEAMLEIHVPIAADQTQVIAAKRMCRAQALLGLDYTVQDAFERCSPAQQAAIDATIVGYVYETL